MVERVFQRPVRPWVQWTPLWRSFLGRMGLSLRFIISLTPLPRERVIQGERILGIASIANDVNKGKYRLAYAMRVFIEGTGI